MAEVDALVGALRDALGADAVVTDAERVAPHLIDWTRRWHGTSPAVVRPTSTEQVAVVVGLARTHGVALVPQGGNTGLVGGSVPHHGEVVLDLRRLDHLGPVELEAAQVTVGGGATLAAVQAHVAPSGLILPVDLAARDRATIGGMVATNAGGHHVVRYGSMRAQVLGLAAVLGTGAVVEANLAGLVKDNTGYDLPGLLCGSEGTLGVVTAVRLRLVPAPAGRAVAVLGLDSVDAAVATLPALRRQPCLSAVELMLGDGLRVVAHYLRRPALLEPMPGCGLLVEMTGEADEVLAALGEVIDEVGDAVRASVAADDPAGTARLWQWREAHSDAAARLGVVAKADVSLPTGSLAPFVAELGPAVERAAPGATVLVFGHLADGNLHVNVVSEESPDDRTVDVVLGLAVDHGGSVSAEHGIGVAKRAWLLRQRGEAAVTAMRAIKAALDPDGILNPGVLLP